MTQNGPHPSNPNTTHRRPGFLRRWVFSTDHKVIGRQYLGIGLFWAVAGGLLAGVIRWHLAHPDDPVPGWGFIGPDVYNMTVTMHGTIMVFFVAMPLLLGAFGNFLLPLMIGARDMAFPRLNMLSVWTLTAASILLLASFFVPGGAAASGWTAYAPLSAQASYTGVEWGQNLWILALALEFGSFLMGGVNFLTTTINMRAPGMTLFRLPLLVWMQNLASVVFLLSVGPMIAAAVMLLLDRTAGTSFFLASGGGEPLLWQHLFWYFGHPEVYVILLPGLGIIMEILPVFARKPIFGYRIIIWSTVIASALSFVVWAHHMFISGMNPALAMPFSVTTILISVPFAVIFFALVATLWRGSIRFPLPMAFTLGALSTFLMGGLTGIFNGSAPVDIYLHDTYFIVAHFHYTLISVTLFAAFAGLYYWYPKMFGRMLNRPLGWVHFVGTFVLFHAVFIPMHLVGIAGMPRRISETVKYEFLKPVEGLNLFITRAAIGLLIAQAPLVINFFWSLFAGRRAPDNPWQANTLEWTTTSPPPHENWEGEAPRVYRGPYDYSAAAATADWLPQHQAAAGKEGS